MPNYNFSHKKLKIKKKTISHKVNLPIGNKKVSPIKLALTALAILVGLLLLGRFIQGLDRLFAPFSLEAYGKKEYTWDGKSAINVILKYQDVSLLHYDPNLQKATILKIPSNVYVEATQGYGTWPIRSIYGLGEEEKPAQGAKLLKNTLTKVLGLPIDGIMVASSDDVILDKEILTGGGPFSLIKIAKNINTDLSSSEALSLVWALSGIRSDKLEYLDLADSNITQSKLLADSSRVLGISTVNLDLFIQENLPESKVSQEGVSVAIFNATSHPLLAQQAARVVANLGADVIIVGNTESKLDKTIVVSSDNERSSLAGQKSLTLKRLQESFAPKCIRTKCFVNDPKVAISRAQVNIILGEDFVTNLEEETILPTTQPKGSSTSF